MDKKLLVDYGVEDFIVDESFINCHFNSNQKDSEFWGAWLAEHPGKAAIAKEAFDLIGILSISLSAEEYKSEFIKIKNAVEKSGTPSGQMSLKKIPSGNTRKKRAISYALVIGLIIFSGIFWFFHRSENEPEILTTMVNNTNVPKKLILSDSTVVTLEPNAKIEYPKVFKSKLRNVYLQGNANFKVKRDIEHPFKVHSENMVATVLGTVFNIKKSGDSALMVELLKGKLNVEIFNSKMETEQSIILTPNERAVYVRNDQHLYKNLIVSQHALNFKQSNFDDVAAQIKLVFGITLVNESPKKQWSFTGTFENSSAKDIIENICLVKNLTYSEHGDTILIK
ncbi:MAG: FecR family protein [Ginsengibacter sp.]